MIHNYSMDKNVLASLLAGEKFVSAEKTIYQKSIIGREAEKSAKQLKNILKKAISENNINVLFVLEHQAIERDMQCYGSEEQRKSILGALNQAAILFNETSTVEGAKNYLRSTTGGKELPQKIPQSDLVQNFIKGQQAELTQFHKNTSSQEIKNYILERKASLKHIREAYIKNLNRGLGKEIEQGRGFER